ncbi:MAG TPA: hypothetical protein VHW45_01650, partial [Candidatus Sulfotelmatobacter sp.]|nr:hypothetical protein [Candidatus Sulfotelmatobacter sp.]
MQDSELQDLVVALSQYAVSTTARLNALERLVKERLNVDQTELSRMIANDKDKLSLLVQAKAGTTA